MRRYFRFLSSVSVWVVEPLFIVLVLVVGFVTALRLSSTREAPSREDAQEYAPLVRALACKVRSLPVVVRGNGALQARTRINLVPQVGGEIVEIHPSLRAGGRFERGDVLARIEPVDFELAVARAEAEVSATDTAIVTTRAEALIAIDEWERQNPGQPCPPLVSKEPHIREMEARSKAARAQLRSAELDLERARITAPFSGRVVSTSIDVGEVVSPNQPVGVVYATDVFEVPVPLKLSELAWLVLPGEAAEETGSVARVYAQIRGERVELRGTAARIEGEVDPTSRLARVVVEIPVGRLAPEIAARVLPGTFVDVELVGRVIQNAVELPRAAMREGGVVWVVDGARLRFARPTVLRTSSESVYVEGLAPAVLVVTSDLDVVTDGMDIRVVDESREP